NAALQGSRAGAPCRAAHREDSRPRFPLVLIAHAQGRTSARTGDEMHPHGNGTLDVDAALGDVARIYRSITGRDLPRNHAPVAPIPPEHDARAVARNALEQLAGQLQYQAPQLVPNQHLVPAGPAAVDCWENGAWLHFYVDLPAVRPEAVQLLLEQNTLLVRAHREREMPEAARPAALERPAGLIERRI